MTDALFFVVLFGKAQTRVIILLRNLLLAPFYCPNKQAVDVRLEM